MQVRFGKVYRIESVKINGGIVNQDQNNPNEFDRIPRAYAVTRAAAHTGASGVTYYVRDAAIGEEENVPILVDGEDAKDYAAFSFRENKAEERYTVRTDAELTTISLEAVTDETTGVIRRVGTPDEIADWKKTLDRANREPLSVFA